MSEAPRLLARRTLMAGAIALLAGCAWTDSKLARLKRDPMASWQPAEPHTEEVDEIPDSGVMEGPTGSHVSTLQRRLTCESAEVAAKVAEDARRAAVDAGWVARDGFQTLFREGADLVILTDHATVLISMSLQA